MMRHLKLPSNWQLVPLSSVADVQTGLALGKEAKADPVRLPYLRVANVQDGFLDLTEIKEVVVERSQVARYSLQHGDVLMTEGGDFDKLGRGYIWNDEIPKCLHQNHVFVVRPCVELLSYFLTALTSSDYGRDYFQRCSKQSTNLASINSSQLKAFPVPLPGIKEQEAITSVLATWDRGSRQLTKLIAAKVCFKQGLIQRLLNGGLRFRGHYEPSHADVRLEEILDKRTNSVCTVPSEMYKEIGLRSHGKGIFHKDPVTGESLGNKRVYRVVPGCLTLNIVFAWERALAVTSNREEGMIASHRFPMFQPDPNRVLADYVLLYLLSTNKGTEALELASPGGAGRNRTLSQTAFLKTKIPLPTLDEQRKIVGLVHTANREIDLLRKQLEALKQQKKGLMQKLLTGEVRVNLPEGVA